MNDDRRAGAVHPARRGDAEALGAPGDQYAATGKDRFDGHVVSGDARAPGRAPARTIPDALRGVAAAGFAA
jgi:hypothetical protein